MGRRNDERIDVITADDIRRSKATVRNHKLPTSTKLAIGKWKEKHPKTTFIELAERYHCSQSQAVRAVKDYQAGRLHTRPRNTPRKKISDLVASNTSDQLLIAQFKYCVAALEADKELTLLQRVSMLEKLTFMRKTIQQVTLTDHMKAADANIIALIIRRYVPDVSDDDVIKIYHEAKQQHALGDR